MCVHQCLEVHSGFSGSISVANVCLWYRMRAEEIEKLSGQVKNLIMFVLVTL